MTDLEPEPLEIQVVENLQSILSKYRQMNDLTDRMLALQANGKPIQNELETLHQNRQELEGIQTQASPAQSAYRKSRSTASDSVKNLSSQTTRLIQTILEKINSLEESTRESYRRLTPEINQSVRSKQMKTAYGNLMS